LGGGAGASGLFGAGAEWVYVPLCAAGVEVAEAGLRGSYTERGSRCESGRGVNISLLNKRHRDGCWGR